MTNILYTLGKYKDKFDITPDRIDRMKIAEEFFQVECADLIKEIERMCGYNGSKTG